MKEPRTPNRKKGGRSPALAKESSNTKLFADDYVTVGKLIKSWGKSESEVIRIIIFDWLRSNRVRARSAKMRRRSRYERSMSASFPSRSRRSREALRRSNGRSLHRLIKQEHTR